MRLRNKETDLVRACLDWLALHGVMAWRANNTGVFDPVKKVYRSFHGRKGVADILGVLSRSAPGGGDGPETVGLFLAVEVKRPGERPRADQEAFLDDIRRRGGVGLCVHSLTELEAGLRGHLTRVA
jgi:hypothetical protein